MSLYLSMPSYRRTSDDLIVMMWAGECGTNVPSSVLKAIWLGPPVILGVRRSVIPIVQYWCLSVHGLQPIISAGS